MQSPMVTSEWKLAMVAALLSESDAASADELDLAAARFEANPDARGIANMLRDRADDIRRHVLQSNDGGK